jgi:predicted ATPase
MELIDRVAEDKLLASNIRQDIAERADGIPLFVEEMTKAVLEAESEGAAARAIAAVPSPTLAVPASLHASLMARLDRLGSAKAIAQIGATIGREFSHALLAVVSGLSEQELDSALDRLVQSGLVLRQGAEPESTYLFKHTLVQDAAYGTLLRAPSRAARPYRRNPRNPVRRHRREPPGDVGASLHRGRPDRQGGDLMVQNGAAVDCALCAG